MFERASLEIILFDDNDIITTSEEIGYVFE